MPRRKRVQLPTPRSLVQLYNFTQPPVLQNSKPDDAGVALAQQAWGVSALIRVSLTFSVLKLILTLLYDLFYLSGDPPKFLLL